VTLTVPPWLGEVVSGLSHEIAFATVSGAHLYGFPSADSDVDVRGVHMLSVEEVAGLRRGPDTLDRSEERDGVQVDLVTHDVAKFCRLMLRPNGYVLEQLLSPLVVAASPVHRELIALAPDCLTRQHAHHYLGFARTQWELYERTGRLKPLLYTFRVLLTGIHLMRTGEVVADLTWLAPRYGLDYLDGLMAAKRTAEHGEPPPDAPGRERLVADVEALRNRLTAERDASALPERPNAPDALEGAFHDLVVRSRPGHGHGRGTALSA
jgi:predicted nucleotidyltransferase